MRTNAQSISRQDQVDSARVVVATMTKTLRTAVMPSQLTTTCTLCTQDAFVARPGLRRPVLRERQQPGEHRRSEPRHLHADDSGVEAGHARREGAGAGLERAGGDRVRVLRRRGVRRAGAACRNRLKTRTLATGVQSDTGAIFAYYDRTGARLTPPTNGTLTADELKRVLAVELVVSVQAQNATKVDPTTYIQRVTLPNAQAVLRQDEED